MTTLLASSEKLADAALAEAGAPDALDALVRAINRACQLFRDRTSPPPLDAGWGGPPLMPNMQPFHDRLDAILRRAGYRQVP